MSKLRQTLRQSSAGPAVSESAAPESAVPAIDPVEPEPAEEIPYIEVGPRRSFEGSPAVLASIPSTMAGPTLVPTPPSAPAVAPAPQPSALPRPHNVLFRSLTPQSRFAPELVAFHAPASSASARYAGLLESMLGTVVDKGGAAPTTMLLLGTRSEAGTTTVLLNVAIIAARQGLRVAVVDANLRRPAIAARLGLEPAPGLSEVLAEERTIEEALRTTEQPQLMALTAGSPAPTLATTEVIRSLVEEMRSRFDLVLVDGPRWDGRAVVAALAAATDAVFLVVPRGEADSPPAKNLVRTLPEQGVRLAGCVLTGE
jgi:Mrp family chromosome partitioning ATPase